MALSFTGTEETWQHRRCILSLIGPPHKSTWDKETEPQRKLREAKLELQDVELHIVYDHILKIYAVYVDGSHLFVSLGIFRCNNEAHRACEQWATAAILQRTLNPTPEKPWGTEPPQPKKA